MSRFFSHKYDALTPYTPGEQPKEKKYIKLNTNESPFPPSPKAVEAAGKAAANLQLYSDPTAAKLHEKIATLYGVESKNVLATNGSDEILNFAFMAFCDKDHPAVFPNITYGFYSVFAELNGV
ncbi:MAG: aminotransferase class I/II-fold pyridoxal phosphate-dependent enzyme, partial [Clostridia bacterium]|nr:aminotransferase class I/II-fold pyridoxal phosphate-dependent enzyme [Clostridia bacterium]